MSAADELSLDSIALQLAAALDTYDRDASAMIAGWPDLERYRGVSDQIERIRLYCSGIPEAAVQWVELLIAHAELVHFLWRVQYGQGGGTAGDLASVRQHHAECVKALRSRCLRIAGAAQERRGDRQRWH
jgi:hypothetical protein